MNYDLEAFNSLVGIPWELNARTKHGADCWGLVKLAYESIAGVTLTHLDDVKLPDDLHKWPSYFENARNALDGWERIDHPEQLAVCMMVSKKTGRPEHVGICVDDRHVLHTMSMGAAMSAIHPLRYFQQQYKDVEFYRCLKL